MEYNYKDKKIVAIIASNVEPAVMTNIIGHLAVSVGKYVNDDFMGLPVLLDKTGVEHKGISKYPFITTKVKQGKLRKAIEEARNAGLFIADFPQEMLDTGHDDELSEAIAKKNEQDFAYLGAIIYGDTSKVDEITGRFQLWRVD